MATGFLAAADYRLARRPGMQARAAQCSPGSATVARQTLQGPRAVCDRHAACFSRFSVSALSRSQLLRNAKEESAPRPVLRGEHADPRAVTDHVGRIQEIDDVEAQRGRLGIAEP